MGHYSLRQFCAFVVACGVFFGGIPHMYFLRLRGHAGDMAAFATEAIIAWLLLATLYASWRQLTPLVIHCLCVALSLLLLNQKDVPVEMRQAHLALATLGPGCWAATLISFPMSLGLMALSAALGRRVEPLTNRLGRGAVDRAGRRGEVFVPRSSVGATDA